MCQCGFYVYSVAALLAWETRRKDFAVMMSHHIITIILIASSYLVGFFLIGSIILAIHDASDVFMESAKIVKYSGKELGARKFVFWIVCYFLVFAEVGLLPILDHQGYEYQGEKGWQPANYPGLCEKILAKSQTVAGFFLVQYSQLWKPNLDNLFNLYSLGKLKVGIDQKKFIGLNAVADAVEYLHSGKSTGKVVVCMDPTFEQNTSRL